MQYLLVTALNDGDYIPDNSLRVTHKSNYDEVVNHMLENIKYFLKENSLLSSGTGEPQITDFFWENPHVIDEPRPVVDVDEYLVKVKEMLLAQQSDSLILYDDDTTICMTIKVGDEGGGTNIKLSYNMAPNRNGWSDIKFWFVGK
jgi:hypothetical protein